MVYYRSHQNHSHSKGREGSFYFVAGMGEKRPLNFQEYGHLSLMHANVLFYACVISPLNEKIFSKTPTGGGSDSFPKTRKVNTDSFLNSWRIE